MIRTEQLTDLQLVAINNLYKRALETDKSQSFQSFLNLAWEDNLMGCVMIKHNGMTIGIEKDGYTHT